MPSALASHWTLDPGTTFLNHGSFGACPRVVQQAQAALREQMESQPVRFFMREYPVLLDAARARLGDLIGARPDDLAFVTNATLGVNTVLRSLADSGALGPGDELLATDHTYNACTWAMREIARLTGATLVVAPVPFPLQSKQQVVTALVERVTSRTRLCLIDHVTSPTGLVLPVDDIVYVMQRLGVDVLVDGAHAPGMLPLDLTKLGAAYYTGNLHKWLCAPKGAAFLWARPDRRDALRALVTSHGASIDPELAQRSRYQLEHDWTGTFDPTAWLSVPAAIDALSALLPGGLPALQEHNRALAIAGRALLCERLQIEAPCPDDMLGSLAALPLPPGPPDAAETGPFDPLQDRLFFDHHIEVPVFPWPTQPQRVVRIAVQAYTALEDVARLADALVSELR